MYILKHKESNAPLGRFKTKQEASKYVIDYVRYLNKKRRDKSATIFDYIIVEVEDLPDDFLHSYEDAVKFLKLNRNKDFYITQKKESKSELQLADVSRLVRELNPKYIQRLIALNQLYTIADAWNKVDDFVPDFRDLNQYKYYPYFTYCAETKKFNLVGANWKSASTNADISPYFKSAERARQFAIRFEDIYNQILSCKD